MHPVAVHSSSSQKPAHTEKTRAHLDCTGWRKQPEQAGLREETRRALQTGPVGAYKPRITCTFEIALRHADCEIVAVPETNLIRFVTKVLERDQGQLVTRGERP